MKKVVNKQEIEQVLNDGGYLLDYRPNWRSGGSYQLKNRKDELIGTVIDKTFWGYTKTNNMVKIDEKIRANNARGYVYTGSTKYYKPKKPFSLKEYEI